MKFIGYEIIPPDLYNNSFQLSKIKTGKLKDTGQRELCGCIFSKDIGQYNTCPHLCEYCYANTSKQIAIENYKLHKNNPLSETIINK